MAQQLGYLAYLGKLGFKTPFFISDLRCDLDNIQCLSSSSIKWRKK